MDSRMGDTDGNRAETEAQERNRDVFLARQPIVGPDGDIKAYELLHRTHELGAAEVADNTAASSAVIVEAFLDFGIEQLVGSHQVFINVGRELLRSPLLHMLPPRQVVIEILESVSGDEETIVAMNELSRRGYTLALDDYVHGVSDRSMLHHVDIVKVDLAEHGSADLESAVAFLKGFPSKLVAEKVETREQFELAKRLGFEWFQGYHFMRPEVSRTRRIVPNQVATAHLLSLFSNEKTSLKQLAFEVRSEPALTHKVLRFVNSPLHLHHDRLRCPVKSIDHAVALLGMAKLEGLVTLLLLLSFKGKAEALQVVALARARMCELLSKRLRIATLESMYTVGLVSTFDAFLDKPIEAVVDRLSLAEDICTAITQHAGPMGRLLAAVRAVEEGDWTALDASALPADLLQHCHSEAAYWADSMLSMLKPQ